MANLINWVMANKAVVFAALFFLSEALALIPSIKANSVFQLVFGFLQKEQQTPPAA